MRRSSYGSAHAARGFGNARAIGIAALLAVIVAVAQWLLWLDRDDNPADAFSGPPRSDYVAHDYTLTARNAAGEFNFRLTGPRATRHPFLGTFDLDEPRMNFRDDAGNRWNARARAGWVNKEGTEVRLSGEVVIKREPATGVEPITIESEQLVAKTRDDLLESPVAVTISEPGSILRGTGMRATLKERHLELASAVSAHYDRKAQPR